MSIQNLSNFCNDKIDNFIIQEKSLSEISDRENFEQFLFEVRKELDNNGRVLLDHITDEINYETNERVIVLLIHLFCDTFLNVILTQKGFDLTKIEQYDRWQFTKKVEILWSLDAIPVKVHTDLLLINKIRNNLAHQLVPDFTKINKDILKFEDYTENVIGRLTPARQTQFCMNETLAYLIRENAKFLNAGLSVIAEKTNDD